MYIEQPLSTFKFKMLIWMVLESKHNNFKGPLKNEEAVRKIFTIRRQMTIPRTFEWYYFSGYHLSLSYDKSSYCGVSFHTRDFNSMFW
jgi:hypothetical protein